MARHDVDVEPDTPLLWVIRENVGLTGTKYGCGIAQCGACTVHIDGVATRSCSYAGRAPRSARRSSPSKASPQNGVLHKVQKAWLEHDVPQCGYCQSGMIMAAAALLKNKPKPTDADIDARDDQHLPLRHLPASPRGDPRRRRTRKGGQHHELTFPKINRRSFVIGTAAAGGGLALGFDVPFGGPRARPRRRRLARSQRLGRDQARRHRRASASRAPRWARARSPASPSSSPKSSSATGRRSRPNIRRRARTSRASAPGATSAPAAAAASATSQDYVRKGGAAARMMLMQAAADEWKVPAAECTAANGVITHTAVRQRTTTYGKVAAAAAKLTPPEKTSSSRIRRTGRSPASRVKRLDTADKLNGKQIYAIDVKLPGMLNAAIKDCPVFGGKLKSFDAAKVDGHAGRQEGRAGRRQRGRGRRRHLVARQDRARCAADRLGRGRQRQGLERNDRRVLKEGLDRRARRSSATRTATRKAAIAGAAKKVEAVYAYPYQNHACMEPMNATALYTPTSARSGSGRRTARPRWRRRRKPPACRSTSARSTSRCSAAASAGAARTRLRARRRSLIAKQMPGTPVKLIWSREEDMAHGFYHPITQCKLAGALDEDNNLTGLHMRISGQSILAYARPAAHQERQGSRQFQGLNAGGRSARSATRCRTC